MEKYDFRIVYFGFVGCEFVTQTNNNILTKKLIMFS